MARGAVSTHVDDRQWRLIRERVRQLGSRATLKVGILTNAQHSSGKIGLADLLRIHEYGTARVPARRPLRASFAAIRDRFAKVIGEAFAAALRQRSPITAVQALDRIGRWAANAVRSHIRRTNLPPPLAASTVKRKGHRHALIDSGEMVDSIGYAVEER